MWIVNEFADSIGESCSDGILPYFMIRMEKNCLSGYEAEILSLQHVIARQVLNTENSQPQIKFYHDMNGSARSLLSFGK